MSQRCHWYANDVGVFVHVPSSAVSSWPTSGSPAIVGRAVFRGAALGVTTAVGAERAFTAPSALIPVTRTRIVRPESAGVSRYVFWVAPATFAQAAPLALQRCHWYWNAVGLVGPRSVLRGQRLADAGGTRDRRCSGVRGGGVASAGTAQTQNAPIIAPRLRIPRIVVTVRILSVRITPYKR